MTFASSRIFQSSTITNYYYFYHSYPREVKVLLPFNSIVSTLKRWRRAMYRPNPTSLGEMAAQLEQPEHYRLLEYDIGRLQSKRVVDSLGKTHIVIYDLEFVHNVFRNVARIFIDGTFGTTPRVRDVYQLVTVLGVTHGHVSYKNGQLIKFLMWKHLTGFLLKKCAQKALFGLRPFRTSRLFNKTEKYYLQNPHQFKSNHNSRNA